MMQVSAQAISFIDDTPYSGEGQYEHLPTAGQGPPQRSSSSGGNSQQQVIIREVVSLTGADAPSSLHGADIHHGFPYKLKWPLQAAVQPPQHSGPAVKPVSLMHKSQLFRLAADY